MRSIGQLQADERWLIAELAKGGWNADSRKRLEGRLAMIRNELAMRGVG